MLNFLEIRTQYPKSHECLLEWSQKQDRYTQKDICYLQDICQSDYFKPRDLYDFFGEQDIKITLFGIIRYDGEFEYAPIIWYFLRGYWYATFLNIDNLWHERDDKNYMPIWGYVSQQEAEYVAFRKGFEILENKLLTENQ